MTDSFFDDATEGLVTMCHFTIHDTVTIHLYLYQKAFLVQERVSCFGGPSAIMARRAPVLLSVAILAFGLLALNQTFVAGPNQPALRGQEAAVAGAVLAALPAAPALATDQYTDSFSKIDAIVIFVPIVVVWIAFLEWDSKQPSADDVTGYGYLGKTIDGPTEDKPAYFRRSPENG